MTKPWREFALRVLWYGGSTFDAWLNIVSSKMASRLLNMPQSLAQLGLPSGIVFQVALTAMGIWTQFIISVLYMKHRASTSEVPVIQHPHVKKKSSVQLHEVIGLLGPKWRLISMLFNTGALLYISAAQLIACSNLVYIVNQNLDKRTWTLVFGGVLFSSIFIPSAHNYRVWSFLGVITIIFNSIYLIIATLVQDKAPDLSHSAPRSYEEYFTGAVGLMVIGVIPIPVEIMDAMWKPQEYQGAYLYGTLTIVLVVMVPSIIMERKFGDRLITTPNALLLLQRSSSRFHNAAPILMLIHVFINFGMYSMPVYAMWERFLRVHDSPSYAKRTLSRVPVYLAFWITALAVPFFGTFNKFSDALLVTWNYFIIPCAAHITFFWTPEAQRRSKSFTRLGWATDFSISLAVILWMLVVQFGLGAWGNLHTIIQLKDFSLFPKCSGC